MATHCAKSLVTIRTTAFRARRAVSGNERQLTLPPPPPLRAMSKHQASYDHLRIRPCSAARESRSEATKSVAPLSAITSTATARCHIDSRVEALADLTLRLRLQRRCRGQNLSTFGTDRCRRPEGNRLRQPPTLKISSTPHTAPHRDFISDKASTEPRPDIPQCAPASPASAPLEKMYTSRRGIYTDRQTRRDA